MPLPPKMTSAPPRPKTCDPDALACKISSPEAPAQAAKLCVSAAVKSNPASKSDACSQNMISAVPSEPFWSKSMTTHPPLCAKAESRISSHAWRYAVPKSSPGNTRPSVGPPGANRLPRHTRAVGPFGPSSIPPRRPKESVSPSDSEKSAMVSAALKLLIALGLDERLMRKLSAPEPPSSQSAPPPPESES